jgi:predicted alpha/beta hydrolase family esterase
MNPKRVLIIHGWGNRRPLGHWHRHLANNLRQQGHVVAYPQLPNTDFPDLTQWLEVVKTELDMLGEINNNELVVVGHSLGCLTWINLALQGLAPKDVSRVLMAAPADPTLCQEVPTFMVDLADPKVKSAVQQAAKVTLFVSGDDDVEWTPRGLHETFGKPLDLPCVTIPGAGHMTVEQSPAWGHWQGVIDWVNDPSASLLKK